jgi:acyl-CoA thioesterase I
MRRTAVHGGVALAPPIAHFRRKAGMVFTNAGLGVVHMLKIVAAFALLLMAASAACAEPVRIVAFGDSSTAGHLVAPHDAYPAQLQRALCAKGYDVEISNAGLSGDTTAGALRRFDEAIAPDTNIAIVEFGINDFGMDIPSAKMHSNLNEIVRTLRARGIAVLLVGIANLDLSDVARANNVPYSQWNLPKGEYRASDGAHTNAEGYAILVARILPQVEELVKDVAR